MSREAGELAVSGRTMAGQFEERAGAPPHFGPKVFSPARFQGAMSGAVPWLSSRSRGVPMPVAVSVWTAGALAVGLSLAVLAADPNVLAEVPTERGLSDHDGAMEALTAPSPRGSRLPDGRDEAGTFSVGAERVRASLPMRHEPSVYGWGTVRLDAEPLSDEVTVHTIVDAPMAARRWTSQCEVVLDIDGTVVRATARSVGTRLKSGVFYDAVRFDLGIDTVRRLARADRVEGTVCGDPLTVLPAQRATLERFVEGFDDLALPVMPSIETELEIMPTDPDELLDDPDTYLEPA